MLWSEDTLCHKMLKEGGRATYRRYEKWAARKRSDVRFNSLRPSSGSCNSKMIVLEMAVITFLSELLTQNPHASPSQHGSVGWSITPYTKRSWVSFMVRAPIEVAGSVPGWGMCGKQLINVSLSHQCSSLSLPPPLRLSKINKHSLS